MRLALALIVVALGIGPSRSTPVWAADVVETQGPGEQPTREHDGDSDAPLISFIDSPTATCYMDTDRFDTCYVEWSYLNVTATSPQYIIRMTVTLGGRLRAVYSGFFQTAMYVPSSLNGIGFKVACGDAGAGGDPDFGNAYAYEIHAEETGGLSSTNYGTVYCPIRLPWSGTFEDGFESGDTSAWSGAVF